MITLADTKYYEAHCPGCGEVTTADLLAFDFGRLIQNALKKIENRSIGQSDKWSIPLGKLDLGLYYTWRDLAALYKLRENEPCAFHFTVRNLKDHVFFLLGDSLPNNDWSEIPVDNLEETDLGYRLCRKIRPPFEENHRSTRRGMEDTDLIDVIKDVIILCRDSDDDEEIAGFKVRVIMSNDDNNNPFPDKLEIQYDDEEKETVLENVCPHCGRRFFSQIGQYKEIVIGMAGSPRVGKTAYLAALIDRLMEHGGNFATVVNTKDDEWAFFYEKILKKYQTGVKIDKTEMEGDKETIPLFSIKIKIPNRTLIFTFIDMPGEAFDNGKDYDTNKAAKFVVNDRGIIKHASMIWFCIAPEQIDKDGGETGNAMQSIEGDRINLDTVTVLENIGKTLEAVFPDGKKNAAVLITRSDKIIGGDLFRPDEEVISEYLRGEEVLNYDKLKEYSDKAQAFLVRDNANKMYVETIKEMFNAYTAFAVAPYGIDIPSEEEIQKALEFDPNWRLPDIRPSMIELPFIWTLAALGYLDASKTETQKECKGFGPFKKWEEYSVIKPVDTDELYLSK